MYVKFEIRLKRRNQIEYLRDERWNRTQIFKTKWKHYDTIEIPVFSLSFMAFKAFEGLLLKTSKQLLIASSAGLSLEWVLRVP